MLGNNEVILKAENVTKKFGKLVAVRNVSLEVREGEIVGLIGSNGAGKTTLFNILTGNLFPEEGRVYYRGKDITKLSPEHRVALGIARTFQLTSTFDNLKVIDNLKLAYYRAKHPSSLGNLLLSRLDKVDSPKIDLCLNTFGLAKLAYRYAGELSLGEKRILEIAMALVGNPETLLLDEPFAGLSDAEIDEVLSVLREHVHRQTIVIVEHKVSKIKDLVERVCVMVEGEIIATGKIEEVLNDPRVRRDYWRVEE
ncbi:MAG: ABC transporter ATP-binding protein [Candidatus Caldatribacterium sp.]|nr:ABC transporter ATP-binding protein [Candidatus Caldatribacterium sp.]